MANNNASNVSVGKPKIGGALFVAPVGTPLPTDAMSALDAAFENLGFVSDAGLTNESNAETEDIKAWGGTVVLKVQTSKEDTFNYTLIESLNPTVLKHVYGDDNVSGNLNTGLTVMNNAEVQAEHSLVIDMTLNNDVKKRIVIPNGKVTEVGTITYVDNEAIGYETTLFCAPDNSTKENTHYEYMQKKPYTVSFDTDGGSTIADQLVAVGTLVTRPDDPTKTGYTFDNWYSDEDLTTLFDFTTVITGDITLYAKWTS